MSRAWTAGFDVFGPTEDVCRHMYERKDSSKFWETVNHLYDRPSIHNELTGLILKRIKYQLGMKGYTDVTKAPASLTTAIGRYGLGSKRPLAHFIEMTGIDFEAEKVDRHAARWCIDGTPPAYKV
jgi:hypothetical protein